MPTAIREVRCARDQRIRDTRTYSFAAPVDGTSPSGAWPAGSGLMPEPGLADPVIARLVDRACKALTALPSDTLEVVVAGLDSEAGTSAAADPFVTALNGGRTITPAERTALHAAATVHQLGLRSQTPLDRAAAGTLLAVRDGNRLRFPAWQFDAEGERGVVPGLPVVLAALEITPLARVRWLTLEHGELGKRTPLAALRVGELDRVLALAARAGIA